MRHVCINTVCVNSVRGEHWHRPTGIVPWSFVFVCICVYQEVESVNFGLVMFAEGQSGPVPKTSRWSQTNLGKYAIHAPAWTHTHTHARTHTHTLILGHTGTHTKSNTQCIWCKQTNMNPGFLFLSLFVFPSATQTQHCTHTNTRSLTENHHLSRLRNRLPIHLSVHFSRGTAMCMKEAWIKADLGEPDSGLICQRSAVFRGCNALTPIDCRRAEGEHFKC